MARVIEGRILIEIFDALLAKDTLEPGAGTHITGRETRQETSGCLHVQYYATVVTYAKLILVKTDSCRRGGNVVDL